MDSAITALDRLDDVPSQLDLSGLPLMSRSDEIRDRACFWGTGMGMFILVIALSSGSGLLLFGALAFLFVCAAYGEVAVRFAAPEGKPLQSEVIAAATSSVQNRDFPLIRYMPPGTNGHSDGPTVEFGWPDGTSSSVRVRGRYLYRQPGPEFPATIQFTKAYYDEDGKLHLNEGEGVVIVRDDPATIV